MSYRTLCISKTTGSGGEMVAQAVAEQLAFRYCDQEILEVAATKAGLDVDVLAEAERHQSLVKRLIEMAGLSKVVADPLAYLTRTPLEDEYYYRLRPLRVQAASDDHRQLIRDAIREIAAQGDVVIAAHAASIALGAAPGVLRVLVTASTTTRVERLVSSGTGLTEEDAIAALDEDDSRRLEYFARFYDVSEELPTHYDLVINTDALTPEQVVTAIVTMARQ